MNAPLRRVVRRTAQPDRRPQRVLARPHRPRRREPPRTDWICWLSFAPSRRRNEPDVHLAASRVLARSETWRVPTRSRHEISTSGMPNGCVTNATSSSLSQTRRVDVRRSSVRRAGRGRSRDPPGCARRPGPACRVPSRARRLPRRLGTPRAGSGRQSKTTDRNVNARIPTIAAHASVRTRAGRVPMRPRIAPIPLARSMNRGTSRKLR